MTQGWGGRRELPQPPQNTPIAPLWTLSKKALRHKPLRPKTRQPPSPHENGASRSTERRRSVRDRGDFSGAEPLIRTLFECV